MKDVQVILGSDHAGYKLKEIIKEYLKEKKKYFEDVGCYSEDSCDYPDYAREVAKEIKMKDNNAIGVVVCGSGNGINMAMNRFRGIRSALCWNAELAELARKHNDANVLALPGRFITPEEAIRCVEKFLITSFEGGRHEKRIRKLEQL